ncbi:MAG TPA: alanine--tRNA ligase-related protein [Sphaerochaeta sp.]|nr:alanine--tRNA ligase-related protein [Sphaerochaeta sp.]
MNSQPVYYEQPYLKSLESTVIAITDEGVLLDKTICYPEGGGQSGDRGTVGGCPLLDTVKGQGEEILHKVENPTFAVGDTVLVALDWDHRHHYMQMHTAQHIASGILHSRYSIGTVSVHQGEKILTIETDRSSIPTLTCYALEDLVNQSIREAHPLYYREETQSDAQKLSLRRSIKVSSETIRLVVVEDVDVTACGGLHLANTSEVGLFQYEGQEKLRSHVRLIFSVGKQALTSIRENRALVDQLCTLHSAQKETLLEVETLLLEQISRDRYLLGKKSERVASLLLEGLVAKADRIDDVPIVLWEVEEDIDMKDVASAFAQQEDIALCAAKREKGKLLWLVGLAGKASTLLDFNASKKRLLEPITGKGGGRGSLFQGVGIGESETLFAAFTGLINETI